MIIAEILDPWSAAPAFADAHERSWSAGGISPLDVPADKDEYLALAVSAESSDSLFAGQILRVMERLGTPRIHDVLADLDEQLAFAVSAVSSKSLSAGGKYTPSYLGDGRG